MCVCVCVCVRVCVRVCVCISQVSSLCAGYVPLSGPWPAGRPPTGAPWLEFLKTIICSVCARVRACECMCMQLCVCVCRHQSRATQTQNLSDRRAHTHTHTHTHSCSLLRSRRSPASDSFYESDLRHESLRATLALIFRT